MPVMGRRRAVCESPGAFRDRGGRWHFSPVLMKISQRARLAIVHGVKDYILKPLEPDNLNELKKLCPGGGKETLSPSRMQKSRGCRAEESAQNSTLYAIYPAGKGTYGRAGFQRFQAARRIPCVCPPDIWGGFFPKKPEKGWRNTSGKNG